MLKNITSKYKVEGREAVGKSDFSYSVFKNLYCLDLGMVLMFVVVAFFSIVTMGIAPLILYSVIPAEQRRNPLEWISLRWEEVATFPTMEEAITHVAELEQRDEARAQAKRETQYF